MLVRSVEELAPAFQALPPIKLPKVKNQHRGDTAQIVVAPLSDTHIGEYVDKEQMLGMNVYSFDIF